MAVLLATTRKLGRKAGLRGIVAAQDAVIRLAEMQEDLLCHIVHFVRPSRTAQSVLYGGENDPRVASDEMVPSLLVATRERVKINTIL